MDATNLQSIRELSPQLFNLLRTNGTPSDSETNHIKNIILDAEFNLTRLEVEIERTQAMLERLRQEHSTLSGQMHAYKAIISPVRRFPSELLAEIFLQVNSSERMWPNKKTAPLLLCQICSVWRNVAIGLPALWSTIEVTFSSKNCTSQMNITTLWLSRAQTLPLNLKMTLKTENHDIFAIHSHSVLNTFRPFFSKCRSIRLASSPASLKRLLQYPPGNLDLLEELHIYIDNNANILFETADFFFKDAPRLRRVGIDGDEQKEPVRIRDLRLPLHQLVYLQLGAIHLSLDAGHQIFLRCTNLEMLSLTITSWDIGHALPPVILPNLKTLTVDSWGESITGMHQLLDMLTLPMLDSLRLEFTDMILPWPHQAYMDLHSRSSFHIRDFSHRSVDFTPDEMEKMLETMPSLVNLTFDWFENNELLQVLTYDPRRPLVPKLEYIRVYGTEARIDMEMLTRMIKSRWWSDAEVDAVPRGVSRLEYVEVGTDFWELESALEDQWNALREEGLYITRVY